MTDQVSEFWLSCRRLILGGFEVEEKEITVTKLEVDNEGNGSGSSFKVKHGANATEVMNIVTNLPSNSITKQSRNRRKDVEFFYSSCKARFSCFRGIAEA